MSTSAVSNLKPFQSLGENYVIGDLLGQGTYGAVIKAYDNDSNRHVAVKHIPDVDEDADITKKIVRELFLLHALRNDHIIALIDVKLIKSSVFVVTEYCEFDLHKLIYTNWKEPLLQVRSNYLSILYQLLQAVQFMHSVGVLHRDIKPRNILLDPTNITVKLCDFGFSRAIDDSASPHAIDPDAEPLTEYVVTRWYRAPEVVLNHGRYGKAQDIWAAACSFSELLIRTPLFPGSNAVHQIQTIVEIMGKPSEADLDFEMPALSRRYMSSLQSKGERLEITLFDAYSIHPNLFKLLKEMLQFNPKLRITSDAALEQSLFAKYRTDPIAPTHDLSSLAQSLRYLNYIDPSMNSDALHKIIRAEVDGISMELNKQKADKDFAASLLAKVQNESEVQVCDLSLSTSTAVESCIVKLKSKTFSEKKGKTEETSLSLPRQEKSFKDRRSYQSSLPQHRGKEIKRSQDEQSHKHRPPLPSLQQEELQHDRLPQSQIQRKNHRAKSPVSVKSNKLSNDTESETESESSAAVVDGSKTLCAIGTVRTASLASSITATRPKSASFVSGCDENLSDLQPRYSHSPGLKQQEKPQSLSQQPVQTPQSVAPLSEPTESAPAALAPPQDCLSCMRPMLSAIHSALGRKDVTIKPVIEKSNDSSGGSGKRSPPPSVRFKKAHVSTDRKYQSQSGTAPTAFPSLHGLCIDDRAAQSQTELGSLRSRIQRHNYDVNSIIVNLEKSFDHSSNGQSEAIKRSSLQAEDKKNAGEEMTVSPEGSSYCQQSPDLPKPINSLQMNLTNPYRRKLEVAPAE